MMQDRKMLIDTSKELESGRTSPGYAAWDLGPRTKSQDHQKVVEPADYIDPETGKVINPNGVVRARRETWVHTYLRKGKLTQRQANIAEELVEASLGMRASDPLAALRIDTSRGFNDPAAEQIDRRKKFRMMWKTLPAFAEAVIRHVVLNDMSLRSMPRCSSGAAEARHLDRLQRGLDTIADAM